MIERFIWKNRYTYSNNQQYTAKARGKFRKNKVKPMVGDFVDFSVDENDEGYILDIQPRKNYLIRLA